MSILDEFFGAGPVAGGVSRPSLGELGSRRREAIPTGTGGAFDRLIEPLLGREGGYSNDAVDRGGETNFGISSAANPDIDVKTLTRDRAKDLYRTRYWDAIGGDQLPANMQEVAFDAAVNHGVGGAQRLLAEAGNDPMAMIDARKRLYDSIVAKDPSQQRFYNGWMNRLEGLKTKVLGEYTEGGSAAPAARSRLDAFFDLPPPAGPEQDPTWGDYGRALGRTFGDAAKALPSFVENLAGIGEQAVAPEYQAYFTVAGDYMRDTRRSIKDWQDGLFANMTPEAQARVTREWTTLDPQKTMWQGGPREVLSSLALQGTSQIGPTMAPLITAVVLQRVGVAASIATMFGAGEGIMSAGLTAAQIAEDLEATPTEDLRKTQRFAQLEQQVGEAEARRQYTQEVQGIVPLVTGAVVGYLAKKIGQPLEKVFGTGNGMPLLQRIGTGAAVEAAQEVPQSGAEQMMQNYARMAYDADTDMFGGVLESMVQGGALGGLMGGGFAGVAGTRPTQQPVARDIQAAIGASATQREAIPTQPQTTPPVTGAPGVPPAAAPQTTPELMGPPEQLGQWGERRPPLPDLIDDGGMLPTSPELPWDPNAQAAPGALPELSDPDAPAFEEVFGPVAGRQEFDTPAPSRKIGKLAGKPMGEWIDESQQFDPLPGPEPKPGLSLVNEGPVAPEIQQALALDTVEFDKPPPAPAAPPPAPEPDPTAGMSLAPAAPFDPNRNREPTFGQRSRTEHIGAGSAPVGGMATRGEYRVRLLTPEGELVDSKLVPNRIEAQKLSRQWEQEGGVVQVYPSRRTFKNDQPPSAEPVRDLVAQAKAMRAGDPSRKGVYLSPASIKHLQQTGHLDEVLGAGVQIKNADSYGGVIVARDTATAQEISTALESAENADLDQIIGDVTGAGIEKPAGADTVVQRLDDEGNVVQERLVTDDQVRDTLAEFGENARVMPLEWALTRRDGLVKEDLTRAETGAAERAAQATEPDKVRQAYNEQFDQSPLMADMAQRLAEEGGVEEDIAGRLVGWAEATRERDLNKRLDKSVPNPEEVVFLGEQGLQVNQEVTRQRRRVAELQQQRDELAARKGSKKGEAGTFDNRGQKLRVEQAKKALAAAEAEYEKFKVYAAETPDRQRLLAARLSSLAAAVEKARTRLEFAKTGSDEKELAQRIADIDAAIDAIEGPMTTKGRKGGLISALQGKISGNKQQRAKLAAEYKDLHQTLLHLAVRVEMAHDENKQALHEAEVAYSTHLKKMRNFLSMEGGYTRSEAMVRAAKRYSPKAVKVTRGQIAAAQAKLDDDSKPTAVERKLERIKEAKEVSVETAAKRFDRAAKRFDRAAKQHVGKFRSDARMKAEVALYGYLNPTTGTSPVALEINALLRQWLSDYRYALRWNTPVDESERKAARRRDYVAAKTAMQVTSILSNLRAYHSGQVNQQKAAAYVALRVMDLLAMGKRYGIAAEMQIDGFWDAVGKSPEVFRDYLRGAVQPSRDAPPLPVFTREQLAEGAMSMADLDHYYVTALQVLGNTARDTDGVRRELVAAIMNKYGDRFSDTPVTILQGEDVTGRKRPDRVISPRKLFRELLTKSYGVRGADAMMSIEQLRSLYLHGGEVLIYPSGELVVAQVEEVEEAGQKLPKPKLGDRTKGRTRKIKFSRRVRGQSGLAEDWEDALPVAEGETFDFKNAVTQPKGKPKTLIIEPIGNTLPTPQPLALAARTIPRKRKVNTILHASRKATRKFFTKGKLPSIPRLGDEKKAVALDTSILLNDVAPRKKGEAYETAKKNANENLDDALSHAFQFLSTLRRGKFKNRMWTTPNGLKARNYYVWLYDFGMAMKDADIQSLRGFSIMEKVAADLVELTAKPVEDLIPELGELADEVFRAEGKRIDRDVEGAASMDTREKWLEQSNKRRAKIVARQKRLMELWPRDPRYKPVKALLAKISESIQKDGWPSYQPTKWELLRVKSALSQWKKARDLPPGKKGEAYQKYRIGSETAYNEFYKPLFQQFRALGLLDSHDLDEALEEARDVALEKQYNRRFETKERAPWRPALKPKPGAYLNFDALPPPDYGQATRVEGDVAGRLRDRLLARENRIVDVLDVLRGLGADHPYAPIIEALRRLPPTLLATKVGIIEGEGGLFSPEGLNPNEEQQMAHIGMETLRSAPPRQLLHTVLHETVHGATLGTLAGNPEVADAWEALRQVTYDKLKNHPDLGILYGQKDLTEFVAEVFSNPVLQQAMKQTRVHGSVGRLWERFKSLVMKLFGADPQHETLWDYALSLQDLTFTGAPYSAKAHRLINRRVNAPERRLAFTDAKAAGKELLTRLENAQHSASNKGGSMLLKALTMRQIEDTYRRHFGGKDGPMGQYFKAFFNRNSDVSKNLEVADVLSRDWTKLRETDGKAEQALSKLMTDATYFGIHPDAAFTPGVKNTPNGHLTEDSRADWQRLSSEYAALPQAAKDLYAAVREYYKTTTATEVKLMLLNALRASKLTEGDLNIDESSIDLTDVTKPEWLQKHLGYDVKAEKAKVDAAERRLEKALLSGTKEEQAQARKEWKALAADFDSVEDEIALIARMASLPTKMDGPYFPLMRFGDIAVSAERVLEQKTFDSADARAAYMKAKRADDPTLQFSWPDGPGFPLTVTETEFRLAETWTQAEKHYAEMVAEYGKGAVSRPQLKRALMTSGQTIGSNRALQTLLGKLEGNAAAQAAIRQFYIQSLSDRSFRKREAKRKNTRGVEGLKQHRTFAAYSKSAAYYMAQLRFGHLMADAKQEMQEFSEDFAKRGDERDITAMRMSEVVKEIETRDKQAASLVEPSDFVRHTVEAGQLYMLLSPSYWAINLMQPFVVTAPYLSAYATPAKAAKAMAHAQSLIVSPLLKRGITSWGGLRAAMNRMEAEKAFTVMEDVEARIREKEGAESPLLKMLTDLKRESIIDLSFIAELRNVAEGEAQGLWSKVMDASRVMAHLTEVNNRIMTAVAAYNLAVEQGQSHENAVDFAKKTVVETQFDYSAANKARLFSHNDAWWKPMVFQFMQYVQHMYVLFIKHLRNVVKTPFGSAEWKVSAKIVGGLLATHAAVGGIVGVTAALPLKWAAGLLIMTLGGGDDEDRTWKNWVSGELWERWISEVISDMVGDGRASVALRKGVPAAFGADLSSRTAFLQTYMVDVNTKTAETFFGSALMSFGGPAFSLAGQGFDAMKLIGDRQYAKAGEKLLPKMARDVIRTGRFAEEGMVDNYGRTIKNASDLHPFDLFVQAVGITPTSVTETYDRNSKAKDRNVYVENMKAEIGRRFRLARTPEDMRRVNEEVAEFNRLFPTQRVNYASLVRSRLETFRAGLRIQQYGVDAGKKSYLYADDTYDVE